MWELYGDFFYHDSKKVGGGLLTGDCSLEQQAAGNVNDRQKPG